MDLSLQAIANHLLHNPFRNAQPESTTYTGKMWSNLKTLDQSRLDKKAFAVALATIANIFTNIINGATIAISRAKSLGYTMTKTVKVPKSKKEKATIIARQVLPYVASLAVVAGLVYTCYTYDPTTLEAIHCPSLPPLEKMKVEATVHTQDKPILFIAIPLAILYPSLLKTPRS